MEWTVVRILWAFSIRAGRRGTSLYIPPGVGHGEDEC
jgi:hypothetical protein